MKKSFLLISLALLTSLAQADSMSAPNDGGGRIVITDRACPGHPQLREAYATSPEGTRIEGCWAFYDDLIHVAWGEGNGQRSTYEPTIFKPQSSAPVPAQPKKNKMNL